LNREGPGDGLRGSPSRRQLHQEVPMSKLFKVPGPRLICVGSARARTNSVSVARKLEDDFINEYNP